MLVRNLHRRTIGFFGSSLKLRLSLEVEESVSRENMALILQTGMCLKHVSSHSDLESAGEFTYLRMSTGQRPLQGDRKARESSAHLGGVLTLALTTS